MLTEGRSIRQIALDYALPSCGLLSNWLAHYKKNGYTLSDKPRGSPPKMGRKPKTLGRYDRTWTTQRGKWTTQNGECLSKKVEGASPQGRSQTACTVATIRGMVQAGYRLTRHTLVNYSTSSLYILLSRQTTPIPTQGLSPSRRDTGNLYGASEELRLSPNYARTT